MNNPQAMETGITLQMKDGIEQVKMPGLVISLLASGDGTEVIHHKLERGHTWGLIPQEGWSALEYLYILSGCLKWDDKRIEPGMSLSAVPVLQETILEAIEDTEFLYVSSQPVFHLYSKIIRELMDLAVQVAEKDGYTADHCRRICRLSMLVGEQMGLSPHQMLELNFGAFLHDVGKIKVPLEVLNKPGKLDENEWEIMRSHTLFGHQILLESGIPLLHQAAKIVIAHHERYDGRGYPRGLKADEIPIGAAIVAVVDSYDAMTTDRVYQKGRSKQEALAEIERCSSTMYHPLVVQTFLSLQDKIDM